MDATLCHPGLMEERLATVALLRMVNLGTDPQRLGEKLLDLAQGYSGCEAVALRVRKGLDFPYLVSRGFPEEFLVLENRLCALDAAGQVLRDAQRCPMLECMCGRVLSGHIEPSAPCFTSRSFWTNSTSDLLAQGPAPDASARKRCHTAGFESVALIPMRLDTQVYGLIQCNDRRRDRFNPDQIALLEGLAEGAANLFHLSMV